MEKHEHDKIQRIIWSIVGNAFLVLMIIGTLPGWAKAIEVSGDILLGGFALFGIITSVVLLNMLIEFGSRKH